jgi:hypothetical protein
MYNNLRNLPMLQDIFKSVPVPVPCTLYPVPCTLYPVPCTLYPVPCTLYLVPCTLYLVPCSLYPCMLINFKYHVPLYPVLWGIPS